MKKIYKLLVIVTIVMVSESHKGIVSIGFHCYSFIAILKDLDPQIPKLIFMLVLWYVPNYTVNTKTENNQDARTRDGGSS